MYRCGYFTIATNEYIIICPIKLNWWTENWNRFFFLSLDFDWLRLCAWFLKSAQEAFASTQYALRIFSLIVCNWLTIASISFIDVRNLMLIWCANTNCIWVYSLFFPNILSLSASIHLAVWLDESPTNILVTLLMNRRLLLNAI